MKLTTSDLYGLIYKSLKQSPEDWTYSDHYHTHSKGIGIPYEIENKEIGVVIWLANGFPFCDIKVPRKMTFTKPGKLPTITNEFKISGLGIIKKWKLYRACKKMVIDNSQPGWDIPVSKKILRDTKINDILN